MIMLFSLKEIVRWLGLTVFEIVLNLLSLTLFTVMLVLKLEGVITSSWMTVLAALFVCDGMNAYFCVIVFIRQYIEGKYRDAAVRALCSFVQLLLLFIFKLLLCLKLEGQKNLVYTEVMSPLFILLMLIMVRACQLH